MELLILHILHISGVRVHVVTVICFHVFSSVSWCPLVEHLSTLCYLFFFDLRILITWIYNYLCNQCPSPLMFESRSWRGVLDTTLCDEVWQWKWQCVCLQHMPTFWNIYFKERQQTCYTSVYITINDNYSSDWHLGEVLPRCNEKLTPSDMIIIRGYIKRPLYKYTSNSALTRRYIVRERRTIFFFIFLFHLLNWDYAY